jgi:hypothetical protein
MQKESLSSCRTPNSRRSAKRTESNPPRKAARRIKGKIIQKAVAAKKATKTRAAQPARKEEDIIINGASMGPRTVVRGEPGLCKYMGA